MRSRRIKELAQLLRLPGSRARFAPLWETVDVLSDVPRDQPCAFGLRQCRPEHRVSAPDRRVALASGVEVPEHSLDVAVPQFTEPQPAKVRDERSLDVGPVHDRRGGADASMCIVLPVLDLSGEPRRQPLTNSEPVVVPVFTCGHRSHDLSQCRLCFLGGTEAALPLFPPFPGERVRANICPVEPRPMGSLPERRALVSERLAAARFPVRKFLTASAPLERRSLHGYPSRCGGSAQFVPTSFVSPRNAHEVEEGSAGYSNELAQSQDRGGPLPNPDQLIGSGPSDS